MKKILALSLLFPLVSWSGNHVENGGDSVAFEFTTMARLAVANLEQAKLSPRMKAIVSKIARSVESTSVHSRESLVLKGEEVDGINDPQEKQIFVSSRRWRGARLDSVETRMGFVLHEHLGVLRIDDSKYKISQELVTALSGDLYLTLANQQSFLKTLDQLGASFWQYQTDAYPDEGQKGVCLLSGEVTAMTRDVAASVAKNPAWFRSDKIKQDVESLNQFSQEIKKQCLLSEANYRILQNIYVEGHEVVGHIRTLLAPR